MPVIESGRAELAGREETDPEDHAPLRKIQLHTTLKGQRCGCCEIQGKES